MIKYEWRTSLDAAEAAELHEILRRAATYDAEPGYSTIDFGTVMSSMTDSEARDKHLLIWMLPHPTALAEPDTPEAIAGLLRVSRAEPGWAEATAVIDPRLRSIGIMTLLLEQVGLDATGPDGWLGTGANTVTCWARGNHPATGRLSNRFLIPSTRRVWQLVRGTQPDLELAGAPVLEPAGSTATSVRYALREAGRVVGRVALNRITVDSEEFGVCGVVGDLAPVPSAPAGSLRRLLHGIAVVAHEVGMTGVMVNVDSDDLHLVNAARLAGFQHDRTDVRYQLGGDA